jgi:hypothetical protein
VKGRAATIGKCVKCEILTAYLHDAIFFWFIMCSLIGMFILVKDESNILIFCILTLYLTFNLFLKFQNVETFQTFLIKKNMPIFSQKKVYDDGFLDFAHISKTNFFWYTSTIMEIFEC